MTAAHMEPGIGGQEGARPCPPDSQGRAAELTERGCTGFEGTAPGEHRRHACPPRRRSLVLPSGIELSLGSVSGLVAHLRHTSGCATGTTQPLPAREAWVIPAGAPQRGVSVGHCGAIL